jgi:hypothetical protein
MTEEEVVSLVARAIDREHQQWKQGNRLSPLTSSALFAVLARWSSEERQEFWRRCKEDGENAEATYLRLCILGGLRLLADALYRDLGIDLHEDDLTDLKPEQVKAILERDWESKAWEWVELFAEMRRNG